MDKGPSPEPFVDLCLQLHPKHGGEHRNPPTESLGEQALRHQVSSLQRELDTTKATLTTMSSDLIASEMLAEQRLEMIIELELRLSEASVSSNNTGLKTPINSPPPANLTDEPILQQSKEAAEKEGPTLPRNRLSGTDTADLHTISSGGEDNLMDENSKVQAHDKEMEELRRLLKFYKENSEKTSQMVKELETALASANEPTYPDSFGIDAGACIEVSRQ